HYQPKVQSTFIPSGWLSTDLNRGRSGGGVGLTRSRGRPARAAPRDSSACRCGGALAGTPGHRACGALGSAGTPSRSGPPGWGETREVLRAACPRGPTSVLAFVPLSDGVRDHPADVEGGHVLLR